MPSRTRMGRRLVITLWPVCVCHVSSRFKLWMWIDLPFHFQKVGNQDQTSFSHTGCTSHSHPKISIKYWWRTTRLLDLRNNGNIFLFYDSIVRNGLAVIACVLYWHRSLWTKGCEFDPCLICTSTDSPPSAPFHSILTLFSKSYRIAHISCQL